LCVCTFNNSILANDHRAATMHNLGHADHEFRRMPITDSVLCRSVIPAMPIRLPGKKREQMAG